MVFGSRGCWGIMEGLAKGRLRLFTGADVEAADVLPSALMDGLSGDDALVTGRDGTNSAAPPFMPGMSAVTG